MRITLDSTHERTSHSEMKGCELMYLTIKQHDMFRTLLMGFEIPFRAYIADVVTSNYRTDSSFETAMLAKHSMLSPASPQFLRDVLQNAVSQSNLKKTYQKFVTAKTSVDEIVTTDIDLPMVGALNLVTFALTENFGDLHLLFGSYSSYCDLAEKYRYSRNKLDHPGCRTLEDIHLIPVLSFVKDICLFLDDKYFLQKSKDQILAEVVALQQRKNAIPISKNNFAEMPYGEARIVCRNAELERVKTFVYGRPEDLRKQHSLCIYGYGGVGKTALVLESLKQIVRDIQDETTINEYQPEYILFFSAKQRKLDLSPETGKFIERGMRCHFKSADELIHLILSELSIDNFRKFKDEGLIVVDNLETLPLEEREKIKTFVDTQTPSEMQFILTSRNSEEYDANFKLAGFDSSSGIEFINSYNEENSLDITLTHAEKEQLLNLAQGNTLVLVLSLRRLSKKLATVEGLKTEFSNANAWKSLKSSLTATPSNTYEVVAEFMYKDTFEHIEAIFGDHKELFYKILKVFAVIPNDSTDISTICLLTKEAYPDVEAVMDVLCNYLIIEKRETQYALNSFAEKYIVGRFLPDAEHYNSLSIEITSRQRDVRRSLEQLNEDIKNRPSLAKIMSDWQIITDIDRINAAKMYELYGEVKHDCEISGRFRVTSSLEDALKKCEESERLTAHPFIKYQRARILQMIDNSRVLEEHHADSIQKAFSDAIYSIKTIGQYASIAQTKSYATLLWIYGQHLADTHDYPNSIRYLEEGKISFEEQKLSDQQYYQCCTRLGTVYLDYYLEDRPNRVAYLRKARSIERMLSQNWYSLGKAQKHAVQLRTRLKDFGTY